MRKHSEIHLELKTKFVATCEIPALIAQALYPDINYLDLPFIDVFKISAPITANKKTGVFDGMFKKLNYTKKNSNWYQKLDAKDEDFLKNSVWMHLPELKFPINATEWEKYGEAFSLSESDLKFEIKPDRVEWAYDPHGDEDEFYKITQQSKLILNMWDVDESADESIVIQKCGIAEFQHISRLRYAIENGKLEQIDPISNIPTKIYKQYGKITLENFKKYAEQYEVSVTLSSDKSRNVCQLVEVECPATSKSIEDQSHAPCLQTNTSISFPEKTVNHDEVIASLFDPVPVSVLEKMFPSEGMWKTWAEKAKANKLIVARTERGRFNPFLAGKWFIHKGAANWDNARLKRTLKNNLPARSLDEAHLFDQIPE